MLMLNDDQLAMIQIGILISEFINPKEMPETLQGVADIVYDNLGVKIEQGERLPEVHQRIVDAIQERDEMLVIGEWFHNTWLTEDLAEMMAKQICVEIDAEIINDLLTEDQTSRFDDAMAGV